MDNAKKSETRQRFRGHPVPLTATIVGVEYVILDADNEVTNIVFDDEDGLLKSMAPKPVSWNEISG